MTNLYDFTVKAQDSSDVQLSKYQGKSYSLSIRQQVVA